MVAAVAIGDALWSLFNPQLAPALVAPALKISVAAL
jgi:hypothetical protein